MFKKIFLGATKLGWYAYLFTNSQWRQAKAWRNHWQRKG